MTEFLETVLRMDALFHHLAEPKRRIVCLKLIILRFSFQIYQDEKGCDDPDLIALLSDLTTPGCDKLVRQRFHEIFEAMCIAWPTVGSAIPIRARRKFPCTGALLQHAWDILTPVRIPDDAPRILSEVFAQPTNNIH